MTGRESLRESRDRYLRDIAIRNTFEGKNVLTGYDEDLSFCGTCQSCGAYWDVRYYPRCPCGGEVL